MRVCLSTTRFYRRRIVDSSWFFSLFFNRGNQEEQLLSAVLDKWQELLSGLFWDINFISRCFFLLPLCAIQQHLMVKDKLQTILICVFGLTSMDYLLFRGLERISSITCLHICHTGAPFKFDSIYASVMSHLTYKCTDQLKKNTEN